MCPPPWWKCCGAPATRCRRADAHDFGIGRAALRPDRLRVRVSRHATRPEVTTLAAVQQGLARPEARCAALIPIRKTEA